MHQGCDYPVSAPLTEKEMWAQALAIYEFHGPLWANHVLNEVRARTIAGDMETVRRWFQLVPLLADLTDCGSRQ